MSRVGALVRGRPAISIAAGLACVLGALLLAGGGSGEGTNDSERVSDDLLVALSSVALPQPPAGPAQAPPPIPAPAAAQEGGSAKRERDANMHRIATVLPGAAVELRRSPDGPQLAVLGDRTEFGSDRNFWIVRRRGPWLGVTTELLPNNRLAWVRDDPQRLRLGWSPWWVDADISQRVLRLRRGKRVVERFAVSVGAPGSPTPPGRYSVTDGLTTRGLEQYYGCCVLALTGHQPNLPPGWIGGDRIAIHGTPGGIGDANSAGCLRATDADMGSLFRRIPLGTPVLIRR